ncbi:Gfo/Idh/MocA family oxidoreductase [Lachnospiraceae bacterium 54-53]
MNFGVIGFGKIGRKFVKSIQNTDGGKIYAIGSKSLSEDDGYLIENPDVTVYQNYQELLEDKNIDAVYIALPHIMHKEWAIKALQKHIAVLCEKPAVLSVEDMEEIKNASILNHTYFLEALKTKFNDGMIQLKEDISYIGKIRKVEANFCFDAQMSKNTDSYLFDPLQGGALNDVGSYVIGFVLDLMNDEPEQVQGDVRIINGVDRSFEGLLTFRDGATAYIEGAIDRVKERYALIYGEHGSIYVPMFNRIEDYTIAPDQGEEIRRHIPIKGDDMTMEIQCFMDDVAENKISSPRHSPEDSCKILRVMNAIRK